MAHIALTSYFPALFDTTHRRKLLNMGIIDLVIALNNYIIVFVFVSVFASDLIDPIIESVDKLVTNIINLYNVISLQ
jgi:hypothetical protein